MQDIVMRSRQMGKLEYAIKRLPESPAKRIFWIVYNQDMIEYTSNLIADIRGQEYLNKYVTVVAKGDPSKDRANGSVFFDPHLLDLLGNGNV
jgi:hypothetical protein